MKIGEQAQVLKTILGHSSLAITMDLYAHVLGDEKVKEILQFFQYNNNSEKVKTDRKVDSIHFWVDSCNICS